MKTNPLADPRHPNVPAFVPNAKRTMRELGEHLLSRKASASRKGEQMKHSIKAIRLLESVGFRINEDAMNDPHITGIFGNKTAEPVNLHPHHFVPVGRDVYVGKAKGGYYVTSHLSGELRLFRQHKKNTDFNAKVCNVFGKGKTQLAAVKDFVANFTATPIRYNVS